MPYGRPSCPAARARTIQPIPGDIAAHDFSLLAPHLRATVLERGVSCTTRVRKSCSTTRSACAESLIDALAFRLERSEQRVVL